jgi:hypothetical protein
MLTLVHGAHLPEVAIIVRGAKTSRTTFAAFRSRRPNGRMDPPGRVYL